MKRPPTKDNKREATGNLENEDRQGRHNHKLGKTESCSRIPKQTVLIGQSYINKVGE